MKIGTKSLLFGYHQFLIHPLFLALGWIKLYGWPKDWRLWLAFLVHDWGYWGRSNMDGPEGENHPYFGARLMHTLFGRDPDHPQSKEWYNFMLFHSRTLARRADVKPSKLCYVDKMAIIIQPTWMQVALMSLTGEIHEYKRGQAGRTCGDGMTKTQWVNAMKAHLRNWFEQENKQAVRIVTQWSGPHYCDEARQ